MPTPAGPWRQKEGLGFRGVGLWELTLRFPVPIEHVFRPQKGLLYGYLRVHGALGLEGSGLREFLCSCSWTNTPG